MCEYCEKRKPVKSCNFCGSASMIVSSSDTMNILDIYGDEKKFQIFKRIYRPRFDINYCPMCGRKLKNLPVLERYRKKVRVSSYSQVSKCSINNDFTDWESHDGI